MRYNNKRLSVFGYRFSLTRNRTTITPGLIGKAGARFLRSRKLR